uniref:Uncharacterized protein n=1 Tax=Romanomermis culicivorax TaxID=13658 RepID=A0A915JTB6_ROMCU
MNGAINACSRTRECRFEKISFFKCTLMSLRSVRALTSGHEFKNHIKYLRKTVQFGLNFLNIT